MHVAWVALAGLAVSANPARDNIAIGRQYMLDPAPNYEYCTDPDDRIQLTDGKQMENTIFGSFWTKSSAVGWNRACPVTITIDLGTAQSISGVSYNTAAGKAGVGWPRAITILVSDDGKIFHIAGELTSLRVRLKKEIGGVLAESDGQINAQNT